MAWVKRTCVLAALVQLAGLIWAGWWFRHALNTDAIAYLRIAEYYDRGQFSLAITGYWGPLLSWLIVPLLKLGCPPLPAARLIMGVSAMIFFWGSLAGLRAVGLPEKWLNLGAWTAALVSIPWSVANITPDLLLAGLMAWAASFLFRGISQRPVYFSGLAGIVLGLAYLAKAVALPFAAVASLAWHGWLWRSRRASPATALMGLLILWLAASLTALPWVAILTHRYGEFTISTSARIAHAIAGPPDQSRYHPTMSTFHKPAMGRITSWEEPADERLVYHFWSPFEDAGYAWHQGKLVVTNLGLSQIMLTTIFLDWPCVLLFLLAIGCKSAWRAKILRPQADLRPALAFALISIGSLALVYLPGYLKLAEQRFFYPAWPFLFICGVWLIEALPVQWEWSEKWLQGALAASFVLPALLLMILVIAPKRQAGEIAHSIAKQMNQTPGPIAGSALQRGGRVGLYVAYLTNRPWHGDEPRPTVAACLRSGAAFIFVNRGEPLASKLEKTDAFRDLSSEFFPQETPVRIFKMIPRRQ